MEEKDGEEGPEVQVIGKAGGGDMRKRREEGMDCKTMAAGGSEVDEGAAREREHKREAPAQKGCEPRIREKVRPHVWVGGCDQEEIKHRGGESVLVKKTATAACDAAPQ